MQRYSDTLTEELQDKVLRIQARHVSNFKSCAFEIIEDMGDDLSVARWIRSQKDEETNNWIVREYQTAPYLSNNDDLKASDIQNMPAESRILMRRACLMDALHACAAFETYEKAKGKIEIGATAEELGIKHYKAAGEEEGIPFDLKTGLPVPAANGIILTEKCALPPLSESFEERSKGNLAKKSELAPVSTADILSQDIDAPEARKNRNIAKAQQRANISQSIKASDEKRMKTMYKLTESFHQANQYGFSRFKFALKNPGAVTSLSSSSALASMGVLVPNPPLQLTILSITCASFLGIYLLSCWNGEESLPRPSKLMKNNGLRFPMAKLDKNIKATRKEADLLTDETDHKKLHQALNRLELIPHLYRTREAFNKASAHGSKMNNKRIAKELRKFEEKAHSLNMPENDMDNMIDRLMQPEPERPLSDEKFAKYIVMDIPMPDNVTFGQNLYLQSHNDLALIQETFTAEKNKQTKQIAQPEPAQTPSLP